MGLDSVLFERNMWQGTGFGYTELFLEGVLGELNENQKGVY